MKIDHHGEGEPELHDGRGQDDFIDEERDARGNGHHPDGDAEGLDEQPQFDAKLRSARLQVEIAPFVLEFREAFREQAGGGGGGGGGEGAEETDCQKRELEAGVEQLIGVEEEKAERHRREQVHDAAFAIEIAGDHEERESGRGPHAGRLPAGDQRVKPGRQYGDEERNAFRHEADAQQEEEERGEHGNMGAGDDDRVECPGGAPLLGPDFLKLKGLADEDRLHHAGLVRIAGIETVDAGEGGGAQVHDDFLKCRAARPGQHAYVAGGRRYGPEDVLPREETAVVERAGVAEIAGSRTLPSNSSFGRNAARAAIVPA